MVALIQFPWSPFCIVQQRILQYAGARFRTVNIPPNDRSLPWRLSKQRYYGVPLLKDGPNVVFEIDDHSQVIAKYLNEKFQLGLFPPEWRGVQSILWRHIESEIEGLAFRLNDIYWEEFVPKAERLVYLRHKERKFGRGCLAQWREQQPQLLEELTRRLVPFEQMLLHRPCLLADRPLFVDFDLYGMLGNFLYSGHYELPSIHTRLIDWYGCMKQIKLKKSEKLRH